MSISSKGKISIVGSGLIGSCWATLFASSGYHVSLYDINQTQLDTAVINVTNNLHKLEKEGLSKGNLSALDAINLISTTTDLKLSLHNAIYVQESTCETVEFKTKIFAEMDDLADSNTILASSTSTIPASQFTEKLKNRHRCIVAHPVNPPLYITLTEMVPSPWTTVDTIDKACTIMKDIGQEPIRLQREVLGFAVNRLQFALLAEAWRLVDDNILSPQDVDKVMSAGLGPRYAFYGPFQTIHMNANGITDYCDRYADGIRRVLADLGPTPTFREETALSHLKESLQAEMPIDELNEYKKDREERLAALAQLKKKLSNQ